MQITYKTYTMRLEDEPLDLGYASEKVAVHSPKGEQKIIGGQDGQTQLIVSVPFIDETIAAELNNIALTLHNSPLIQASAALVVANENEKDLSTIEGFDIYVDREEAFGDMYSVRLTDGPLDGELTKALFVISKDGALFYDEIVPDLQRSFDADKALSKIAVAQDCYTGKGCH